MHDNFPVVSQNTEHLPHTPKGKKEVYSSSQTATPLWELTCHIGSHSVTCHPAEVTFLPLPQPIKAGTRFSNPGGMQGWVTCYCFIRMTVQNMASGTQYMKRRYRQATVPFYMVYATAHLSVHLLPICRPSGCTMASGIVRIIVGVCNRSQMRTSKCTYLIFDVSMGLDPS